VESLQYRLFVDLENRNVCHWIKSRVEWEICKMLCNHPLHCSTRWRSFRCSPGQCAV